MTLQEMVHQAATLYSDRNAVCFDECNDKRPIFYTYNMVANLATELTVFLQKHCDQRRRCEIGLYCYPGINLPSWILGILQVPAAYSPVDPDAPPVLSTYFMKKCNLQYILVENDKVKKFRISHSGWFLQNSSAIEHIGLTLFQTNWKDDYVNIHLVGAKDKNETTKDTSTQETDYTTLLDQFETETSKAGYLDIGKQQTLAYILHTSGTTGLPKVVRVPHKCIVPNIHHLQSIFKITQDDVLFLASPLTFDPSVVELFIALTSGASLLIVPNPIKMMPQKLSIALFHHHRVTVLQATPTFLRKFGAECIKSSVLSASTSLRVLALGGESFPALDVLRSWKDRENKTHIFNLYGITEVSSWATCYKVPEEVLSSDLRADSSVPLGSPLLGTTVEVKDACGSTVLEGGKERICFLDDEVTVPLGTMRETGDFVRMKGAEMFFLGRKDSQIKRHGKRLNIECIQQAAESLCQVEACAVIWYQQEKLVLFVVPKDNLAEEDAFKELQKCLPVHAVPDELVLIEALPLTLHGKINTSELNKIYSAHLNSIRRDSKLNGAEELWERLQHLWKSILSLPDEPFSISKDSVFLYSGGDSIKSLRFHDEIENLVGKAIPGLLEVILSSSIAEVYRLVLKTVFPSEDQLKNPNTSMKRKLNDSSGEEAREEHVNIKSGGYVTVAAGLISFVALSRGSHIFCVNCSKSFINLSNMRQARTKLRQSPLSSPPVISNIMKTEERRSDPTNVSKADEMGPAQGSLGEDNSVPIAKFLIGVRWTTSTGKCVDASPLVIVPVTDDMSATVYIGSHSHTMQAIDLDSGKIKWERILGDRIESSACVSKCGSFIVVGGYNGLVYVLRSNNGETHWMFTTEDAVKSSAALDPSTGLVYVGSHDQHVYALDIYKKECIWKLHCEGGAVFASPRLSLLPHHLYIATLRGCLLAVNPDTGSKIWKSSCGKPLFSSPHCSARYVCVGCVDGNLYCFSHSGEKVWQFSTNGPIFSSPCISNLTKQEIFFGSHDCFIYSCNMEGNLLWKFKTTSSVYATPFVFHSHDLEREAFLAAVSTDGNVWLLNAKSGMVEGIHKLPGEVFSSPVVCGERLIVGCRNDYVYCLDLFIAEKIRNSKDVLNAPLNSSSLNTR
ncbi:PREDICTED: acyl-CoA synthetase family member 4 isoform X2 [Gavialis gangeticus]|uniref:acyl-CoA synthetase family member 4 isoform X2 n=1 Tax=Gavialis gangeticus TaxID=94835 RepID=UPI00092FB5C8|nr:PREDICTED: acyl-CoA synthetase family member 4 isoform X2 [Gavialis gangeticus]